MRSTFHRGYVLVSFLYYVLTVHLSASEIVLLGTVMSVILIFSDIPAGVLADAIGRRWPLVIGQLILASSMITTGLVTKLPLLVVAQLLWGLGWAFINGADTAWLNDELNEPNRIARVLTKSARRDLIGGITGMMGLGVLAWATSLSVAIVVSGIAMALLAVFVAFTFKEQNFKPIKEHRWDTSILTFKKAAKLSRKDNEILIACIATLLFNAASMIGWLYPKQLIHLGFPSNPVVWYAGVAILSSAIGYLTLHFVEARIDRVEVARKTYALACLIGVAGLILLATAPVAIIGAIGVLMMGGIASNITRPVGVIWVNRRTSSDIRATIHSFLSQAESVGEVIGGILLVIVARVTNLKFTIITSSILIAITGIIIIRSRADHKSASAIADY